MLYYLIEWIYRLKFLSVYRNSTRKTMKKVISVRFKENGKSYYFDPAGAEITTTFEANRFVSREAGSTFRYR